MNGLFIICFVALPLLLYFVAYQIVPAREYYLNKPISGTFGSELQLLYILWYGFRSIFCGQKPEHVTAHKEGLEAYERSGRMKIAPR